MIPHFEDGPGPENGPWAMAGKKEAEAEKPPLVKGLEIASDDADNPPIVGEYITIAYFPPEDHQFVTLEAKPELWPGAEQLLVIHRPGSDGRCEWCRLENAPKPPMAAVTYWRCAGQEFASPRLARFIVPCT